MLELKLQGILAKIEAAMRMRGILLEPSFPRSLNSAKVKAPPSRVG
jgi:hypothetical protein